MALIKQINYKGTTAEYWNILLSMYNKKANQTTCLLGLYVNQQARQDDINNNLDISEELTRFDFAGNLDYAQIYDNLKNLEQFENSLDS